MTRGLALRVAGRLSSSLARDRPLHTKVAQNGYRMYQQQVVGTSRTFGVQFNSGGTKATVPRRLSVLGGASMARHFSGKGWGPQSVMEKGKQLLGGGASGGGWSSKITSLVKLPKLGSGADLRQAMSEKVLSFWQQNRHIIIGAAFSVAVYYVWRTTYGIASMFIDLTETFAELGFLALAVALAGAGCLWIRERARINPDKLFRLAMTRLNTSPSVLGVMGAPLTGSHLQASVQSGGGLRVKGRFGSGGLKVRSTRLHMIYPVSGPDARGVVSIEAKKKRGRHQFKLLAIDVVTKAGREERIFLEGNESYYRRGGVLSELRDPFLKVAAAQTMYEIEDDEEEEEARAIAESSQQSGMNTTVGAQQELKQLYFYEWAWEYAMTQLASLRSAGRAKPVKSAQSRH